MLIVSPGDHVNLRTYKGAITVKEHLETKGRQVSAADAAAAQTQRKPYQAPRLVHEAELEVRAGSPLFEPGQPNAGNPWDPDYGQGAPR